MIGAVAAILLGFLGFVHPAFDTIANFRWHFGVGSFALALIWYIFHGRVSSALIMVIAVVGIFSCYSIKNQLYIKPLEVQLITTPDTTQYSLLHLNLYYANPTPQKVFDLIKRTKPDIMAFNELSDKWKQRLNVLDRDYPYSYHCPEWTVIGGSVIYSKLPMTSDIGKCHNYAALALKDIVIEGKIVTIGSVHLRWPWPASGPRQVDELKPVLSKLGPKVLIAGDFNSTSWSWLVRRFASYGNLKIVKYSGASWMYRAFPASLAKMFGLSLDNAMVKGAITIISTRTLEPVGSDHLPLITRFTIN